MRLASQGIEHSLDSVVVGIDDSVIENDRSRRTSPSEHPGKGQSNEKGDLLLGTTRENVEVLFHTTTC